MKTQEFTANYIIAWQYVGLNIKSNMLIDFLYILSSPSLRYKQLKPVYLPESNLMYW